MVNNNKDFKVKCISLTTKQIKLIEGYAKKNGDMSFAAAIRAILDKLIRSL